MKNRLTVQIHDGKATGYTLWLSKKQTELWANKPGAVWPCSQLSGHRIMVEVDQVGLCDYIYDGKTAICSIYQDEIGNELRAIVADYIPDDCRHLWPVWNR